MKRILFPLSLIFVLSGFGSCVHATSKWEPAGDRIKTRWAAHVDPDSPHPEYPRPQMVRGQWKNLNGLWDYAVTDINTGNTDISDGTILVPFAVESSLSGVVRTLLSTEKLWYKRTFDIPGAWKGKRILLHFGAVDYISEVKINGHDAGSHQGGNTAFSFDITDYLNGKGEQEITVAVTDPSDEGRQPRGKQVLDPKGIYYTAVSGIWKTVWLEPVGDIGITGWHGIPDIDKSIYRVNSVVGGAMPETVVRYTVFDGTEKVVSETVGAGETAELNIPGQKLWSPDSPFLYDLKIEVLQGGDVVDEVGAYFGMRKISVARDAKGVNRIMLNNRVLFNYGFLDQGWWPDGLLTPPTDEALLYDIEFTKRAGFNTIRKHIKVEWDRFYYHCDRLGLLVWQDAVSGDKFNLRDFPNGAEKDPQAATQYEKEWKATIDQLRNHPSIVNWVVFNEGWGQYGGKSLVEWTKQYDPSRLAEISGWVDMGNGDIADIHKYPGPGRVDNAGSRRAFVVGEFGGLGLPCQGHLWNPEMRNWGYATYATGAELTAAYEHMIFQLTTMIPEGLSGAIYTQTTDVEGEVNGMLTYDREVVKIPEKYLFELHRALYGEGLTVTGVMDDAQESAQKWYYTKEEPTGEWSDSDTPPAGWPEGDAPFGFAHPEAWVGFPHDEFTDRAHIPGTIWKGKSIWLWREFEIDEIPANLYVRARYDKDVAVYINGVCVLDVAARQVGYYHSDLSPVDVPVLKKGKNHIAVKAGRNTGVKRSKNVMLDVGLVTVNE